jgi:hypothetical protein
VVRKDLDHLGTLTDTPLRNVAHARPNPVNPQDPQLPIPKIVDQHR